LQFDLFRLDWGIQSRGDVIGDLVTKETSTCMTSKFHPANRPMDVKVEGRF
jgi:hypothetical protein